MDLIPGLCIISGIALIVLSLLEAWNIGIIVLGGLLMFLGTGFYALYLYLRSKQGG